MSDLIAIGVPTFVEFMRRKQQSQEETLEEIRKELLKENNSKPEGTSKHLYYADKLWKITKEFE